MDFYARDIIQKRYGEMTFSASASEEKKKERVKQRMVTYPYSRHHGLPPFPGSLNRVPPYGRIVLSEEQKAWLFKWFPKVENRRIMAATGLKFSSMHKLAHDLGLKKSEKGLHGIMKRQSAYVKKLCEANGYYDSMRGKKPSPQCYEGFKRYLESDEYEHPMRKMQRKNPRKYKKYVNECSEKRKNLWEKEKKREFFGLSRETKLLVRNKPFTKSQVSHRYNALKKGYLLSEDCSEQGGERFIIFYDEYTNRSPIFEKNCIKDGFRFEKEI